MTESEQIRIGVGAVVFKDNEVLLIKRGKPPFEGQWSIPGGGLEYGERITDAVTREVREETGVEIDILGLLDVFEAMPNDTAGSGATHTVMIDYVAEWVSGAPIAGDDAAEAEFVTIETALERVSWDKTRQAIRRATRARASTSSE